MRGPGAKAPKTDYEDHKVTSLASAFSGLSVQDFGKKEY